MALSPALRMGGDWHRSASIASTFRHRSGLSTESGTDAWADRVAAPAIGVSICGTGFGIPNRHPSYRALVRTPTSEAVYVATPHPMHLPDALLALRPWQAGPGREGVQP